MNATSDAGAPGYEHVSTGRLPAAETVQALLDEAYSAYASDTRGSNSQVYPALAAVPPDLFGACIVDTSGRVHAVGDSERDFTIMSVSKPFVFALVCQEIGPDAAHARLGANSTGLAFNSLAAIERGSDGRTNPMVNPGAIMTTSLVPGATVEDRWRFIVDGLSRFAGRPL